MRLHIHTDFGCFYALTYKFCIYMHKPKLLFTLFWHIHMYICVYGWLVIHFTMYIFSFSHIFSILHRVKLYKNHVGKLQFLVLYQSHALNATESVKSNNKGWKETLSKVRLFDIEYERESEKIILESEWERESEQCRWLRNVCQVKMAISRRRCT